VKFLVDAHLPFALCSILRTRGHDAVHTRELPDQNATSDAAINDLSMAENRVVISKDTDFYYSHLLHGKPFKLLQVRTGNLGRRELVGLFERNLDELLNALETSTLVEMDRGSVRAVL
jgi:predicted nuclease of predicted toxin-antitoxin system